MAEALDPAIHTARTRTPKRLLALRGERHLVARLRAGDEAAFEVLYDRYAPALLSFCRHMLGRREEAEDAVQLVFAAAHADLERNTRELELKPWLYAIARNRCLSMLRARREQPDDQLEPSTDGLQDEVQARADLRELVGDLADLPENQRAALLLTELEDLSHAEAASVLDCEASQVKGLVFRAREGLIERRDARSAPCEEIRAELSTARKGALRRGRLRHHLAACEGCSAYLADVRRQRKMMALILPVIPATGLKRSVLAAAGIGTGAGGAGGLTVAGGVALTGTAAKIAAVAVLAGGAGVAGEQALDHRDRPAKNPTPAAVPAAGTKGATPRAPGTATPAPTPGAPATAPRRRGATPATRRAKRRKPATPADQRSASNRGATPPGQLKAKPQANRLKVTPVPPVTPPGQAKPRVQSQAPAQPTPRKPAVPPGQLKKNLAKP